LIGWIEVRESLMTKFTITRSTGMVGIAQNIAVYLNGELVDKLTNDESKTLTFEGDSVELQVGQSFMKSHKIQVKNGQKVLVKASGIRVMLGILGTILGLPYLLLESLAHMLFSSYAVRISNPSSLDIQARV